MSHIEKALARAFFICVFLKIGVRVRRAALFGGKSHDILYTIPIVGNDDDSE